MKFIIWARLPSLVAKNAVMNMRIGLVITVTQKLFFISGGYILQKLENMNLDDMISDTKIPIRIAYLNSHGVPGVISLWYVQINDKIYCATKKNAKLTSYLEKNPSCGFEIAADKLPYKGIRGNGIVKILPERGKEILDVLIDKYLGGTTSTLSNFLKTHSKNEVAIEITPQKISNYDYSQRMRDV